MYKITRNALPFLFQSWYVKRNTNREIETRSKNVYMVPRNRTTIADKFIITTGASLWNELAKNDKIQSDLGIGLLKKDYKAQLINKYLEQS